MRKILLAVVVLFSIISCDNSESTKIQGKSTDVTLTQRTADDEQKEIDNFKKNVKQPTEQELEEFRRSANFNPNYEGDAPAARTQKKLCYVSDTVYIAVDSNGCYHLGCGSTQDDECHGALWAQWNCFWHGE